MLLMPEAQPPGLLGLGKPIYGPQSAADGGLPIGFTDPAAALAKAGAAAQVLQGSQPERQLQPRPWQGEWDKIYQDARNIGHEDPQGVADETLAKYNLGPRAGRGNNDGMGWGGWGASNESGGGGSGEVSGGGA